MSSAEFEEKEFEQPLNGQLCHSGLMWSPGQVLEEIVGFDVALYTVDAVFWAACGYASPPQGAVILPAWWPSSASVLVHRAPPSFAVNVFLQHKRPQRLTHRSASEWSIWKSAYFRFGITNHQQAALEACAIALGQDGIVAYASPAFHKRHDLFNHIQNQSLVANTHFAPAERLSGHRRYTYVSADTFGVAHSEPVRVSPLLFELVMVAAIATETGHQVACLLVGTVARRSDCSPMLDRLRTPRLLPAQRWSAAKPGTQPRLLEQPT